MTDRGTVTPLLDPAARKAKQLIGAEVARVYGLPGHLRTCAGCGRLNRDCVCEDDE